MELNLLFSGILATVTQSEQRIYMAAARVVRIAGSTTLRYGRKVGVRIVHTYHEGNTYWEPDIFKALETSL